MSAPTSRIAVITGGTGAIGGGVAAGAGKAPGTRS